jgi:murein DD-endopeptidase MepM/ murein hydrolase activator NlpD
MEEKMLFPLRFRPVASYKDGGRFFGAPRDGGDRNHAGCDLIAPEGAEILAVADGEVIRGPYPFFNGTDAIEVNHGGFVARYCEIKGIAAGVAVGEKVTAGQVIAYVGKMKVDSMLHFEMYSGEKHGPLTQKHSPFKRRADLMDPTPYLDDAELLPSTDT